MHWSVVIGNVEVSIDETMEEKYPAWNSVFATVVCLCVGNLQKKVREETKMKVIFTTILTNRTLDRQYQLLLTVLMVKTYKFWSGQSLDDP